MKKNIFAVIFILGFLTVIQGIVHLGWVSEQILPGPLRLLETFWLERAVLIQSLSETALSVAISFGVAFVFSTILGCVFHMNEFLERSIFPIALFFQTVPIIAIAPLLVIYFGFGRPTVVAASTIVCFFPMLAAWMVGLKRASALRYELFRVLRATKRTILFQLEIPTAVPYVLAGLKSAAGLAVVGAVTGEFVAGGGLGGLIDSSRLQQRIDLVFCGLILLAFLGLFFIFLTEIIFKLRLKKYLYD